MISLKKHGAILMEKVVELSIILIIVTISLLSYKALKIYKSKLDLEYSANELIDILNVARGYSRNNNCETRLELQYDNNKNIQNIYFISNTKIIKDFKLKEGIKINEGSFKNIIIDKTGYITKSTTILLQDEKGKKKEISIMVGTSYVNLKK